MGIVLDIEYEDKIICVVSLKREKEKAFVISDKGKKITISESKIFNNTGYLIEYKDEKEIISSLKKYIEEVEEVKSKIDLKELWEVVYEDTDKGYSLEEISEIYYGKKVAPYEKSAMLHILEEDKIYFRRKKNLYFPELKNVVDAKLQKIEKSKSEQEEKKKVVEWLKNVLYENKELFSKAAPPKIKDYINLIMELAVYKEDFPNYRKAVEFIKEFSEEKGSAEEIAFNILVKLGKIKIDENLSLIKYNISRKHTKSAILETESICSKTTFDLNGREDLTKIYTFSIDDEGTSDIDDALSLEILEDGFNLGIHIADASYFIQADSHLDQEASIRGTTIYLPEEKIPMLPLELSDNLISLKAGKVVPTLSFLVKFNKNYEIIDEKIIPSFVIVNHNFSYEEADTFFNNNSEIGTIFHYLNLIALNLFEKRQEKGAISIQSPELKIKVDEEGKITLKLIKPGSPSRQLVSEFMILANYITAKFCWKENIPAIYRHQDIPDEVIEIKNYNQFDYVQDYKIKSKMKKSEIGTFPSPHFGLGLNYYTQVTSPIRRYYDLIMQRQIISYITSKRIPYTKDKIMEIVSTSEEGILCASLIESERKRYWILKYLEQNCIGNKLEAIVIKQLIRGKYLVELIDYLLKIPLNTLVELKEGDRIILNILSVNPREDKIIVSL